MAYLEELHSITIHNHSDDDFWIIKDHSTGVTTQGESKTEALLMLVDALAAHEEEDVNLVELAEDVFVMDDDVLDELEQEVSNESDRGE